MPIVIAIFDFYNDIAIDRWCMVFLITLKIATAHKLTEVI